MLKIYSHLRRSLPLQNLHLDEDWYLSMGLDPDLDNHDAYQLMTTNSGDIYLANQDLANFEGMSGLGLVICNTHLLLSFVSHHAFFHCFLAAETSHSGPLFTSAAVPLSSLPWTSLSTSLFTPTSAPLSPPSSLPQPFSPLAHGPILQLPSPPPVHPPIPDSALPALPWGSFPAPSSDILSLPPTGM